ncbi:hypothetical protein GGD81_001375 [Rhodobium orientis]|uniref:Uncharacterized protein n=1 Tax=Rhodobium orientis TaxID=34017 RepID=A0A327JJV7_9HYPH|nr:hypothetical protein [Rhodobium orientis]MBB4302348.1 hypothetical protein [Rhodobium orientis]MBK5949053.1 hypothetical protein [Rhodobium orientis]RAI26619.1 hypothetical protein CH339_13545 [Rhodobium orientis]
MSREFGSFQPGYLYQQIDFAVSDLADAYHESSRVWSGLLSEFQPVAVAICGAEACDTGPEQTIIEAIEALPRLRKELETIENFLAPYKAVAEQAIKTRLKA